MDSPVRVPLGLQYSSEVEMSGEIVRIPANPFSHKSLLDHHALIARPARQQLQPEMTHFVRRLVSRNHALGTRIVVYPAHRDGGPFRKEDVRFVAKDGLPVQVPVPDTD